MSRLRMLLFVTVGVCLTATGLVAQSAAPALSVKDAWVRATAAGRVQTGGFMVIENTSATPRKLVSASADVASPVELHEMKQENGMMRMSPVKDLTVPAKGVLELKPGSFHLMLFGLKTPLTAGQTINLTLVFDDGTKVPVKAEVRAPGEQW